MWVSMLQLNIHGVIVQEATEMNVAKKVQENNIYHLMLLRFEKLVILRVEK